MGRGRGGEEVVVARILKQKSINKHIVNMHLVLFNVVNVEEVSNIWVLRSAEIRTQSCVFD